MIIKVMIWDMGNIIRIIALNKTQMNYKNKENKK